MVAEAKQLDDTIEIVTPENIAFDYRIAGPFRRLLAYLIDYMLRLGIFVLVMFILCMGLMGVGQTLGGAVQGVLLIFFFFLTWFYGGVFETVMNGQTPGKRLIGIRVLTTRGQPINGLQAMGRNFLRSVDEFPVLSLASFPWLAPLFEDDMAAAGAVYILPTFVLGLIVMASNRRFQRMGDLVCGTMVLIEERQWLTGSIKLEDPRAMQLAEYIPANFVVTRTMARAIATYADRRRFFSPARRREVARHMAEPLLQEFQLPPDTSHDLLLCALYHRTFVLDRPEERKVAPRPASPAAANKSIFDR